MTTEPNPKHEGGDETMTDRKPPVIGMNSRANVQPEGAATDGGSYDEEEGHVCAHCLSDSWPSRPSHKLHHLYIQAA